MIKYDSKTHDLLKIAKVMQRPFSADEAIHIIPRLDKPSRVKESAQILIKFGFLKECDGDKYAITPEGREELYAIVSRTVRKQRLVPDDEEL